MLLLFTAEEAHHKGSLLTASDLKDSGLQFPLVTSLNLFCVSDRFIDECSWSSLFSLVLALSLRAYYFVSQEILAAGN